MTDAEIIEALATKVMGWVRESGPDGDWYEHADIAGCGSPVEYFSWNPRRPHGVLQIRGD